MKILSVNIKHRYALAVKILPLDLLRTLRDVVKIVNHIRDSATSSRIFKVICDEVGANFNSLLYHIEVRCYPVVKF